MDEQYQKLKDYAFKVLSFRPRSTCELRLKLNTYSKKHELSDNLIDKVITDLTENKYLNDEDFTRWWIEQRSVFRQKGKVVLRIELKNKGISREIIEKVLLTITNDREIEMAKNLLKKKLTLWENLPIEEKKGKISNYLLRRGFNWEAINVLIDEKVEKS